jgi:1-acyl-sn-glycerol-3-phosphate acyltransferase
VTFGQSLAQGAWIHYWRHWQRYHRYSVQGLENIDGTGPKLIVGYHARGIAMDMCMLTVALFDRYGHLPHGFVHRGVESFAPIKRLTDALGFLVGDGPELAAAVARGEHLVTTPGGGREGLRGFWDRYRVSWGDGLGYVKLAVKYRLPIVPVGCAGADDLFIGLNDATTTGAALRIPPKWGYMLWIGLGPLGAYPFSPPFPVRLSQLVGAPLDPFAEGQVGLNDKKALERVHQRVTAAVQATLDQARAARKLPWEVAGRG